MNKKTLEQEMEEVVLQTVPPATKHGITRVITLKQIYNYFATGLTTKGILRADARVSPETITLARAYLIANHPRIYSTLMNKAPANDYKVLIDECITPRIIPALKHFFGHLTHTKFEGLNGKPDQDVWRWAVNRGYDAIITRDTHNTHSGDLTFIAEKEALKVIAREVADGKDRVDLSRLPLVIHTDIQKKTEEHFPRIMKKFNQAVYYHIENRTTPYIMVSVNGRIICGKTYAMLIDEQTNTPVQEKRTRAEQWAARWKAIIVKNHNGAELTKEQKKKIDEMVRTAAQICVQKVSLEEANTCLTALHITPSSPPSLHPAP